MKPLYKAQCHPWVASLFAVSLCLSSPLTAKCPTDSVVIHGKVECFKGDAKVLVKLIFFDRQPEASGEDVEIAVHDGIFSGQIPFDTYSSAGFFGGDRCHRRPRRVLIRLLGADGGEKDRTTLEIKSDFVYDQDGGRYTPKSDITMHGWCPPQHDDTSVSSQDSWRKLDAGPFSIFAPAGWEFHQRQGIDTYVGEFVGNGVALSFDFGQAASGYLKETRPPVYVISHEFIGGYAAKIARSRTPGHGITGVFFEKLADHDAFCLWGKDLTATQQELALKIFQTIRFGGPVPPYVNPPPPPAAQRFF